MVTIQDDEAAIQFAQPLFTATEGTPGTVTLIRTGPLTTQATVSVNISAISAVPGVDFTGPLSRTLTFALNVSRQSFQITTVNSTLPDGNRSVRLSMAVPSGGVMPGLQDAAIFTIVDDDQPGSSGWAGRPTAARKAPW